ncbi:hypothetical protein C8K18_10764 [Paraburkholderia sp. GV068]|nr:hypothetical protein C8K19_10764 [Paraburkholderia sp. GV072]PUB03725.1 hypothetical protein C8K18_10764 [Paraburkholderia sp. GV068]
MITVSLMMYPVTLSQTKARVGIQERIEDKDDLQVDWQGEQRRAVFHGEKQRKEKTEEQQAGIVARPKDRTRTRCIRYCLLHLATIPTRDVHGTGRRDLRADGPLSRYVSFRHLG